MNLKTKILIGILIVIILTVGGWWIWNNIQQQKGVFKEAEIPDSMRTCDEDSDCALVYGSCSCDAVNKDYKDNRQVLEAVELLSGGMECFANECDLENIFAVCKNERCTKVKEQIYTSGNLEEYESKLVEIKGIIKKVSLPKLGEPDHYVLCDFENFTAYHYFDDYRDEPDCIPLVRVALSTSDIEVINESIENLISNPLNKKVNIIGRVFIYEVDPKTCHMASIGCQKWVGVIPIEIKEDISPKVEEIKQKVTINTEKTEYRQGETVRITMINGLDQPIVPYALGSDPSAFYGENYGLGFIERFENIKWIQIEPLWRCGNSCFAECKYKHSFEPNETRVFEWNQTQFICDKENRSEKVETAGTGRYRISVWIEKEQSSTFIYSNEFVIK